jgi:hypothetical protein
MHCAPVVPHDKVMKPPLMTIDKARLRRERYQIIEQRAPLHYW